MSRCWPGGVTRIQARAVSSSSQPAGWLLEGGGAGGEPPAEAAQPVQDPAAGLAEGAGLVDVGGQAAQLPAGVPDAVLCVTGPGAVALLVQEQGRVGEVVGRQGSAGDADVQHARRLHAQQAADGLWDGGVGDPVPGGEGFPAAAEFLVHDGAGLLKGAERAVAGVGEQAELDSRRPDCRPSRRSASASSAACQRSRSAASRAASAASCARTSAARWCSRRAASFSAAAAAASNPAGQRLRACPAMSGPLRPGRARSRRVSASGSRLGSPGRPSAVAGDEDRDERLFEQLPVVGEDPADGSEQPAVSSAVIDRADGDPVRCPGVVQAGPHPLRAPRGPAGARGSGTRSPAGRGRGQATREKVAWNGAPGTPG